MPPWEGCRGVYGRRILTLAAPKCVYSWVGDAGADLERAAEEKFFILSYSIYQGVINTPLIGLRVQLGVV
jgi:hypothetical protein